MFDFSNSSLWTTALAFLIAAAFVWAAGTRLARYLDRITEKADLGEAFVGLLLLGGITSLPEIATASSASWIGNAPLAINNVLGSAAINVVLLAIADALLGREALTSVVGQPTPLLQGTLDILLFTVIAMAIATGDVAILGVGAWSMALVPLFLFALWLTSKYERRQVWVPSGTRGGETFGVAEEPGRDRKRAEQDGPSLRLLVVKTCVAALVILVAGIVLATTGDVIAQKTGVGAGLVGLVLVGFATSLPEISSIYEAVRLKRYSMVLGDIFGTNIFNVLLIFLADLLYAGPPVLAEAGTFELVATLLATLVTCIYMIGLLERGDRTFLRMGYPSFAVIITFVAGLVVLFAISGGSG